MRKSILLATLLAASHAQAAPTSVVAVFQIQDATGSLSQSELAQMTAYLSASIAQSGVFDVVPDAELRRALQAQKAESYDQCFDESCQIEIGKEVAAQKALVTKIVRIGSRCAVTTTLIDLAKAASERAGTAKSECNADAIVRALEGIVDQLRPGEISVTSQPTGAKVLIDGQSVGYAPLVLEQPAGHHEIELRLDGYSGLTTSAIVRKEKTTVVRAKLVDAETLTKAQNSHSSAGTWSTVLGVTAAATAIAATTMFLIAPSEADIRANEYDQFLSSRAADARATNYLAVEDAVSRHNTYNLTGWALSAASAAALTGAIYLLFGRDEPSPSTIEVVTPDGGSGL